MNTRLVRTLLVGGSVAAAVFTLATPAGATPTFTVTAGSAPVGTTVNIKGTTKGTSPQITFKDTTSGQTLNCTSGTATGTTKTGSGLSGSAIGKITASTWNGCTGPAGLVFSVTQNQTWKLNATSGTATGATGSISSVKATVSDPGVCTFVVTGSVKVTYSDSSTTLSVPGTTSSLTVSSVSGCFGVINNGDKAAFVGKYSLKATNSAYNPVHITSP